MAVYAVSITKDISWRGQRQRFSNVYHYRTTTGQLFADIPVIDEIVRLEKIIHATTINFVEGRTWGPTDGSPADNKMREVKQLTGTGSNTPTTGFYPELAIMIYWPMGRYGTRNRPQFLRKWLHLGRGESLPTDGSRFTGTEPTWIRQYITGVEVLNPVGITDGLDLCAPNGENEPIQPGIMYPYLEHRQLGR